MRFFKYFYSICTKFNYKNAISNVYFLLILFTLQKKTPIAGCLFLINAVHTINIVQSSFFLIVLFDCYDGIYQTKKTKLKKLKLF